MTPSQKQDVRPYCVVFRAYSAVHIQEGSVLQFRFADESAQAATVDFRSIRIYHESVQIPAKFILAEVSLSATSLETAMSSAHGLASGLSAIIGFAANALIGNWSPELCFDSSSGDRDREFRQYYVDMPPLEFSDRLAPKPELIHALTLAVTSSQVQARINRSIQQYESALEYSKPGQELLCLSHTWMAAEAITRPVRDSAIALAGGKDALLAQWGIDIRRLDSEVRRRLIFRDSNMYRLAKEASDGFEHGFSDFGTLRESVTDIVPAAQQRVRDAILDLTHLTSAHREALKRSPWDTPVGLLPVTRELRLTIGGEVASLPASGRRYPVVELESTLADSKPAGDGAMTFTWNENLRFAFGKGVRYKDVRMLLHRPGNESQVRKLGEIEDHDPP